MSIISDALKKANQTSPNGASTGHSARKQGKINWSLVFIAGVFLVVAGPLVLPGILKRTSDPHRLPEKMITLASVEQPAAQADGPSPGRAVGESQFAVEEKPVFDFSNNPNFRLEGIVISDNARYAVVNGEVVTPGQAVGGAELISVAATRVELDYQGKKIVLHSE